MSGIFFWKKETGEPDSARGRTGRRDNRLSGSLRNLGDLLAPGLVYHHERFYRVGDIYYASLYISNLPRRVSPGWLDHLLTQNVPHDVDFALQIQDSRYWIGRLQRRRKELSTVVHQDKQKGRLTSAEVELSIDDIEPIIEKLEANRDRIARLCISITTWSATLPELEERLKQLQFAATRCGADARALVCRQDRGFRLALPDGLDPLPSHFHKVVDGTSLAYSFPFASTDLLMENGAPVGFNLYEKSPVAVDLWDRRYLSNPNIAIMAKPGGGKSFFAKTLMLRLLCLGVKGTVIDPENEYDRLCTAVGGRNLQISSSRPGPFNPFVLPCDEKGRITDGSQGREEAADPLAEKITTLVNLIRLMLPGQELSWRERNQLDRALMRAYARCGVDRGGIDTGRVNGPLLEKGTLEYAERLKKAGGPSHNRELAGSFGAPRYPNLADVQQVLEEELGEKELAVGLHGFIEGSYASFLNLKPHQLDPEDSFVVFKLRQVSQELKPLVIAMVMDWEWSRAVKLRQPAMFIVDEMWSLLRSVAGGELVAEFARRSRKLGLSLVVATQQIDDFLNDRQGKVVLACCDTHWVGPQVAQNDRVLREALGLNEDQVLFLTRQAQRGQALLKCGSRWVPLQVEASPAEYALAETNPPGINPE